MAYKLIRSRERCFLTCLEGIGSGHFLCSLHSLSGDPVKTAGFAKYIIPKCILSLAYSCGVSEVDEGKDV